MESLRKNTEGKKKITWSSDLFWSSELLALESKDKKSVEHFEKAVKVTGETKGIDVLGSKVFLEGQVEVGVGESSRGPKGAPGRQGSLGRAASEQKGRQGRLILQEEWHKREAANYSKVFLTLSLETLEIVVWLFCKLLWTFHKGPFL